MKKQLQTLRRNLFKWVFAFTALAAGYGANAQINYNYNQSTATYTSIAGGTVINSAAGLTPGVMDVTQDDGAVILTLPFTFTYNGNAFTSATFCTNGWVGMGSQNAVTATQSRAPANLFISTVPNNTLAPWFRDMGANFGQGGTMVHGLIGTDVYAFEWKNAVGSGFDETAANLVTFMAVIYGPASVSPGRIEFRYGSTAGTTGFSTAIGIENATSGTNNYINAVTGTKNATTLSSAWPGNGTVYRFTPLTACTGAPTSQPSSPVFSNALTTQVDLSFAAAPVLPSLAGYLVVRYPTGATPTAPTNGTSYTAGQAIGTGVVVGVTDGLSIQSKNIVPGTTYDFYVYATGFCITGPEYNVTSPLVATYIAPSAGRFVTTAAGGLWSAATTWVGGLLPSMFDTVEVATGATLNIDVATSAGKLILSNNAQVFLLANFVDSTDLVIGTGATYNGYFATTGRTTTVYGNIQNSGTLNFAAPATILAMVGRATPVAQSIGGSGTFSNIPTLTINNTAGVALNTNITVPVALNLTNGIVSGSGTLTLGNSAFSNTFTMTSTGGSSSGAVASGLSGVATVAYAYNAKTPAGNYTTGNELTITAPNLNVTIASLTAFNVELGTSVNINNLTLNDTLVVNGVNTLNVNGLLNFSGATSILSGTGSFTHGNSSTLQTANLAGLTLAGNTGSVQTVTRTFNPNANYTYNGAATQVTGNGLPALLTGNSTVIFNTTTQSNLSQATVFNNFTISTGVLAIGANDITVNGIANIGTFAITGTGAFTAGATSRLLLNHTNAGGVLQAAAGNIQTTGLRTFTPGLDIVIGGSAVATGLTFPATGVDSLVLNQTTTAVLTTPIAVNTLFITSTGRLTTTATNLLTIAGTASGSVARSSTGYIDGPLARTIPTGATGSFLFPLGAAAVGNLGIDLINPVVTGGNATVTGLVRSQSSGGTAGTGLTALSTNRYWAFGPVTGGTLTGVGNVRVFETSLAQFGNAKKIGAAVGTTPAGVYNSIGGTADSTTITVLSGSAIPAFGTGADSTYFVLSTGSASGAALAGGTYSVGPTGTYKSLTSAIADINERVSLSGPVVLEFQPTYSSGVETYPIVFRATLPTTATNKITIRPASGVASEIVFSAGMFNALPMINFNGGKNIVIDGRPGGTGTNRYITFNQTNTGTFPTVQFINDAQNNVLRRVNIKGNNTSTSSAVVFFTTTNAGGGNNADTIDFCTIDGSSNSVNMINSSGTAAPADNKGIVISNNNIYDFFLNGSNPTGIIAGTGSSAWTITSNNFYQTAARTTSSVPVLNSSTQFRAVQLNNTAANAVFTVTNNRVGGNIPGIPGSVFIIGDSTIGTSVLNVCKPFDFSNVGSSAPTSVQNNVISDITIYSSSTSDLDVFTGIAALQAGAYNIGNITGNTIGAATGNGSITVIWRGSAVVGNVRGIQFTGTSGGLIQNNTVGSITMATQGLSSTTASTLFGGISAGAVLLAPVTISNNLVGSLTTPHSIQGLASSTGAVAIFGIQPNGITGAAGTVTNNTIANLTSFSTANSGNNAVRGLWAAGVASVGLNISNNTIRNLRADAPNNNASNQFSVVMGLTNIASGTGVMTMSDNVIHSLSAPYNGPVSTFASGIFYNATTTGVNSRIERNVVHSLETGSSNQLAFQVGINIGAAATAVQVINNFVRVGINVSGSSNTVNTRAYGIWKQSVTSASVINNTVYVGGTGVTGDTNSVAFLRSASGPVDSVMNNIFANFRSNTSGTGKHYAMFVNNTTNLRSDANLYFANGTGGVLFRIGSVEYTDLRALRSINKGFELRSGIANPSFNAGITNAAGTINFTLNATSPAATAAIPVTSVTVDQGGNVRSSAPAIGSYDIGLSALTAASDVYIPSIVFTVLGNRPALNTAVNNINVKDIGAGVPLSGATAPRLWYRNATTGSAWASVQPNGTATGTINNGVFSYTFNWASIGGTPSLADKIKYYFVAQDQATSPNIAYSNFNATDPLHSSVSVQTIAPTTNVDSFLIVSPLAAAISIPTDYPSFSGAGGLFESINNAALGANTVVTVVGDVKENGLNELRNDGMSGFSLRIQADGTPRTLWGDTILALLRFNGVSKVTIDGGVGRNLKIVDSVGLAPSALSGPAIQFYGGSTNDTIVNCVLESNASSTTSGTLVIGAGANMNFVIANNEFKNVGVDSSNRPANAIFINGTGNANITIGGTALSPGGNIIHDFTANGIGSAAMSDNFLIGHLTDPANGNIFYNRANGAAYNMVNLIAGNNHVIANNKGYQASGVNTGIITGYTIAGSGNNLVVTKNSFGGSASDRSGPALISSGGSVRGIVVTASAGSAAMIDSNYISNIGSTGTSAAMGIDFVSGSASILKNIVGFGINPYDTIQNRFDNGLINIQAGTTVLVENNKLGNVKYVRGASAGGDRTSGIASIGVVLNLTIRNNIIKDIIHDGTGLISSQYRGCGIALVPAALPITNVLVEGNTIYNITSTNTTGVAAAVSGILVGNVSTPVAVTNSIFRGNRIYNIGATGAGTAGSAPVVHGINVSGPNSGNNLIINNQISIGTNAINQSAVTGIRDEHTAGTNDYLFNSIFINGTIAAGTNASYGILRTSTGTTNAVNNLIYNRRTGGTARNYAIGSTSATAIAGNNLMNNLLIVKDTAAIVELPSATVNGWSLFNTFYTTSANTNWAELDSIIGTADLLFTDTLTGNLGIVTSSAKSWYANGKGIRVIGQTGDFTTASGVRSGSIATGAVDIGSVEFTPGVGIIPPAAYADKLPAVLDSTTYYFASRQVAKINWNAIGNLPSTLEVRYYSGVTPANVGSRSAMNAYWDLQATGSNGYDYMLTLPFDSAVLGTTGAIGDLKVARYTGTASNWFGYLGGSTSVSVPSGMMAVTVPVTSFGIFTGTNGVSNPLPVKLLTFTADAVKDNALLSWATAFETNNAGFEIERSVDGKSFESVDFVKASGNRRGSAYEYTDADAFGKAGANTIYYRLRQRDLDGTETLSTIATVIRTGKELSEPGVYPNPFTTDVTIDVVSANAASYHITVVDVQGKEVYSGNLNFIAGRNVIRLNELANLKSGIYFAKLSGAESLNIKLVKAN